MKKDFNIVSDVADQISTELAKELDRFIVQKYRENYKYIVISNGDLTQNKYTIEYREFKTREELEEYIKSKKLLNPEILDLTEIDKDPELQKLIQTIE